MLHGVAVKPYDKPPNRQYAPDEAHVSGLREVCGGEAGVSMQTTIGVVETRSRNSLANFDKALKLQGAKQRHCARQAAEPAKGGPRQERAQARAS